MIRAKERGELAKLLGESLKNHLLHEEGLRRESIKGGKRREPSPTGGDTLYESPSI